MLEVLNSIDTNIFLFLNGIHSSFFDNFMYAFSSKWVWVPFYVSIVYIIIKNWKKEAIYIILAIILCITLADQISSSVIKSLVARPRPTRAEELEGLVHIVNGYRGGQFGFVSSHAANSLALATFCAFLFKEKIYTWIFCVWAFITGYSRIYLGVHYPFDILGGFIVGFLAALFCLWLLKTIRPQAYKQELISCNAEQKNSIQKVLLYLPLWVLLITTIGTAIYSIIQL